jgi:hypothetical protein
MISPNFINDAIQRIETSTEDEVRNRILGDAELNDKTVRDNDYQLILEYLKGYDLYPLMYTMYLCSVTYEEALVLFKKIINAFHIIDIDIEKELHFIIDNATMKPVRSSEWEYSTVPLIDLHQKNRQLVCCAAYFKNVNNFGREQPPALRKIFYNQDREIVWIKDSYLEFVYFLFYGGKIYGIKYNHKKAKNQVMIIYKDIKRFMPKKTVKDNLDAILLEYENKPHRQPGEISINLDGYFEKGFFYKGPKWVNEYPPEDITVIKGIKPTDDCFTLEIENVTYPHTGYVSLDLKSCTLRERCRRDS